MVMANPDFHSWYSETNSPKTRLKYAEEIFTETLIAFKSELSKDKTKLDWIVDSKCSSLADILTSVTQAREKYEARKGDSKIRETLCDLSSKIHHYGAIMDVLVQHHPEYTSLAWGAMKVLFVGVVNQQNLLSRLSTGLCEIADLLPRAELILDLFPTERVKDAIVAIYSYVLRFLLRALRWYQESKAMHIVHSITRPTELRYDDLLRKISALSRNLAELASVISYAEQRDLHTKVQELVSGQESMQSSIEKVTNLALQMNERMATESTINASARIELRHTLSEIQLSQFLAFLSTPKLLDPAKTLQASLFMRNRRRFQKSNTGPPFWEDPRMQAWNQCSNSSLVMINATRKLRFQVKDFCADSITLLRDSGKPVIWALKTITPQESDVKVEEQVSTIEILKCLIAQAIQVNTAIHTDAALAPRLHAYLAANTEEDWFNILASVLQVIPLLYIIIDVELLHPSLASLTGDFSWPAAFLSIFSGLEQRNVKTVLKVTLVSYGSPLFRNTIRSEHRGLVMPVGGVRSATGSAKIPLRRGIASSRGRGSRFSMQSRC